jgi:hypothetical protein
VSGGRGPGAPSATLGRTVTPDGRDRAPAGLAALDLSAVRRTDSLIEDVVARRPVGPEALSDPALRLLSALASDVDSGPSGLGAGAARRAGRSARAVGGLRPGAAGCPPGWPGQVPHDPAATAWLRTIAAAVAVVTLAGAATTTGVAMTGLLTRLARQMPAAGGPQRGRPTSRSGRQHGRTGRR